VAKKKSPARLDREISKALGKNSKLWPTPQKKLKKVATGPANLVIQRARDAERKIAEIARTRRPTEAETAEANEAYAAAAAKGDVPSRSRADGAEKVCRYCGQQAHWSDGHFECGGEGNGVCSFWSAISDYDRAGRPKDVESWLDGWLQREVGTDWAGIGWDRAKHAKAIRDYFKLG
jgi:hypothetical protein